MHAFVGPSYGVRRCGAGSARDAQLARRSTPRCSSARRSAPCRRSSAKLALTMSSSLAQYAQDPSQPRTHGAHDDGGDGGAVDELTGRGSGESAHITSAPQHDHGGAGDLAASGAPSGARRQRVYELTDFRGHRVNYRSMGPKDAALNVMFVHGFGASVNHWLDVSELLSVEGLQVHSLDLLGFGASEKPKRVHYCVELWSEQVCNFIRERGGRWVLSGNSMGSLIALDAAVRLGGDVVAGVALMNCAGGLTAFRYRELTLPFRVLYFFFRKILFNRVIGRWVFNRFKSRENIRSTLLTVYGNKDAVTEDRVEMLYQPATDKNAIDVFLRVLDGPAGPEPEKLLQQLHWCPVLVVWGKDDPWTPLSKERGINFHPGEEFSRYHPNLQLEALKDTGHCPHDERPEIVADVMLQWMRKEGLARALPARADARDESAPATTAETSRL